MSIVGPSGAEAEGLGGGGGGYGFGESDREIMLCTRKTTCVDQNGTRWSEKGRLAMQVIHRLMGAGLPLDGS